MSTQIKDVVHFHNGSGGGVWTVIANLLKFSKNPQIRNHVVFTIHLNHKSSFVPPKVQGAASVKIFDYSPKWNFYYTCRQLKKLLTSSEALIVAHDWLELGMVSNLGLPNPVVQFLHGDYPYYYELAKKNNAVIDRFVTVTERIKDNLIKILPERKHHISYIRFPVPIVRGDSMKAKPQNIIFIGRLTRGKGYHLLPMIAKKLCSIVPELRWHVVGEDVEGLKLDVEWDKIVPITFYGTLPNEEVNELLRRMHYIILPSIAEGMPVSIIEAMKAGVVPLVNDISGGLQEIIINGQTGFRIKENDVASYAEKIAALCVNPVEFNRLSVQTRDLANQLFDPVTNTANIESLMRELWIERRNGDIKTATKIYGSRLDQPYLPNSMVCLIRSLS
jgi:glycosyltransferase involved in cell wall biosynthesis